jgi:hypothetical protein
VSDQNPYAPPPGGAPSPSAGPPADQPPAEQSPPLPQPTHQPTHQPGHQQPYQPYPEQPYQQQPYPEQPYQQQPYPEQPYQQQPYPEQPYQQQPYPAAQPYPGAGGADDRPTSTLAVVGFIVSLAGLLLPVALIGLILSLIALPGTGSGPGRRKGRGFAIAGAIIGGILTLLGILSIVFFAVAFSQIDADGDGNVTDEEIEDFFGVESGVDTGSEDDFEDLFENTAVEGTGPAAVPADPAALVVA